MERLNDIMTRTLQQAQRRRRTTEQRPSPETTTQRTAPHGLRQPLHEQTARLGPAVPPPRTHTGQGEASRPPAPLQRSAHHMPVEADARPTYQQRPHASRESQYPPKSNYYHEADVAGEWEDDATAMRYGDWEGDEHDLQAYERPAAESAPRVHRSLDALTPASEARSYVVQAYRDVQMPPPPPPLPSPQVSIQEVRHYQRTTQPLNPRLVQRMSQDMPPEASPSRTTRPTRQLVPREQTALYPPPAPATPASMCPVCKGAGYLRADVPYGHPNFGKPIACECKEAERAEKRRQQLREMSNLDAFRDKSFKNFNPRVPGVHEAYQIALEFAQNPNGWLLLIGRNGCGKTHLAAAIANQRLACGSLVLFATVPDLLDHLRATFAPASTVVYDQLFSSMREAELLILDDLGSEQNSPWASEKLFQLLNYRYNSHFPTVITTNSMGLQAVDDRIRSRLMDKSLVIEVTFDRAQDYRPHNPRRN